ncbi:MAG TPA: hypothetical protein VMB02_05020 [Candidatus Aquilonibacter sp.]|nr:hypothetical protein [Candidatus Aquilonibacter sp.]
MALENVGTQAVGRHAGSFFFHSPLRSISFVANTILFAAVVIADAAVLLLYWRQLSGPLAFLLFLLGYQGGVGLMIRAWRRHAKINELYENGLITNVAPESPFGVTLQIAADALNDGLFYSFSLMLVLLFIIVHITRGGRL